MNLPNRLTLVRMALVPVFVCLVMVQTPACQVLALIVFVAASLTDWFDGWYARAHGMVTDFGKLMDPMADKLLVMAALIALVAQNRAPWLVAMVLLGREFIVSGIRLVAASKGKVIAADRWGKFKTAAQMVGLSCMIAGGFLPDAVIWGEALLWASVALSVGSCALYIRNNREVFKDGL